MSFLYWKILQTNVMFDFFVIFMINVKKSSNMSRCLLAALIGK